MALKHGRDASRGVAVAVCAAAGQLQYSEYLGSVSWSLASQSAQSWDRAANAPFKFKCSPPMCLFAAVTF